MIIPEPGGQKYMLSQKYTLPESHTKISSYYVPPSYFGMHVNK
jgi:hypothetical protein